MRVLICGGRDYNDRWFMFDCLDKYEAEFGPFDCVIEGGARGVDTFAKIWANDLNIPVEEYPADWKTHGKSAGYIRNKQMLDEGKPDLVIAFPGGPGTFMIKRLASESGVKVIEF